MGRKRRERERGTLIDIIVISCNSAFFCNGLEYRLLTSGPWRINVNNNASGDLPAVAVKIFK